MSSVRIISLFAFPLLIVGSASVSRAQNSPSSLPIGSLLQYSGSGNRDEAFMFTGESAFESEGDPGSYTFLKTGDSTASVTYTMPDRDEGETETATLSLTFTSNSTGHFTATGNITENNGNYTFTSYGTFVLILPKSSEVPEITDDFNDNSQNTSKWGADLKSAGSGTLTETNQRLEYTCASANSYIHRSWNHGGQIHFGRDWEMAIDISNISAEAVSAGLAVFHPTSDSRYVETNLFSRVDSVTGINWGRIETGPGPDSTEILTPSSTASLRISYSSAARRINCYADFDGPSNGYEWRAVGSYSVETWGMSGSQPFRVTVFGQSWSFLAPAGSVYLDNFRITTIDESTLDTWKRLNFGDPSSADAADLHDYDQDGISNLMEYACGLLPKTAGLLTLDPGVGISGLPNISTLKVAGDHKLRLEFVRRTSSSDPGIIYVPQFSSTLTDSGEGSWETASGTPVVTPIDASWERVVIEDTPASLGQRFGRVKVTRP